MLWRSKSHNIRVFPLHSKPICTSKAGKPQVNRKRLEMGQEASEEEQRSQGCYSQNKQAHKNTLTDTSALLSLSERLFSWIELKPGSNQCRSRRLKLKLINFHSTWTKIQVKIAVLNRKKYRKFVTTNYRHGVLLIRNHSLYDPQVSQWPPAPSAA